MCLVFDYVYTLAFQPKRERTISSSNLKKKKVLVYSKQFWSSGNVHLSKHVQITLVCCFIEKNLVFKKYVRECNLT